MGESPDVALYTLFLRALLQQNKWQEGELSVDMMVICISVYYGAIWAVLTEVLSLCWDEVLDIIRVFSQTPFRTVFAPHGLSSMQEW